MKRIAPMYLWIRRHGAAVLLITLGVLTLGASPLAAYEPVPGGELLDRFRSPLFLGSVLNTASTEAVSGDAINPAVSALKQRVHLDASYAAILGDSDYDGHAAHLGLAIPTAAGVITGSLHYAGVEYDHLDLWQRGSLNIGFAKELYPWLLAGAGVAGQVGARDDNTAFAGGLNLGVIHLLGPVAFLDDLRWGFSITQIGNGLAPRSAVTGSNLTGSPAPFTPAADVQATLVKNDVVQWDLHTGFSAPSFQNLVYRAGTQFTLWDRVGINAGWQINLREHLDDDRTAGSMLPSLGLTARFETGSNSGTGNTDASRVPRRNEIRTHAAWAPLYEDVWSAAAGVNVAFGVVDRNPPVITLDYPETAYISPNNDGLADELLLPVEITDERYVMSWALVVRDADGSVIRRIENKEYRPESEGFRSLLDRILYVRTGVEVPEQIRWDGRTDAGSVAPDGEYTFVLEATDDNDNLGRSDPKPIVVDNTPPSVTITEPENPDDLIFAPGDAVGQDSVVIEQTSSREDLWTVQILDASDTVVFETEFRDTTLEPFEWDGRDNAGAVVPDGAYRYYVHATDRALNYGSGSLDNIIVDTIPTPVGLAVNLSHFSPNDNGRQDEIILTPDVIVREGIRDYTLEILDRQGRSRRTIRGEEDVPEQWVFDGRGNDGRVLPEGTYRARLTVLYRNGAEPIAESPSFVLDVTPPRLAVIAEDTIFSPNSDGRKDTIAFTQETEEAPWWRARIENELGEAVRTYEWEGTPPTRLVWDGLSDEGERLPDGEYRYILTGEDRAGNRAVSPVIRFELDTRETPVFVSTSREAFAPGTTGPHPTIDLITDIADPRGAERFFLELLDQDGTVVARIDGSGAPRERYTWDGRGAAGGFVPDGDYRARLVLEYRHGNRPTATSATFSVDTVAPTATVRLDDEERAFSPDGDGLKDTMPIVQSSSPERLWRSWVESAEDGTRLRTWETSGTLADFEWDGTNDQGEVVPDGVYRYVVTATDAAGNSTTVRTATFRSDTRDVEVQLRLSDAAFGPNGNGIKETVTFIPQSNIEEGIAEWNLRILDTDGEPVRTATGTETLDPFVWDGRDDTGNEAPDGEYRGEITVRYVTGAVPTVRTVRSVLLDRVPPDVEVSRSTEIISPDGDGRLDEVTITQETSREERWVGSVRDDAGNVVRRWEWVGNAPETLVFAGLDEERRRLPDGMYSYELTATDLAGNTGSSGRLPLEIYTAETPLDLYADITAFSPNDSGVRDEVTFRYRVGEARGLQTWEFVIHEADSETGEIIDEETPVVRQTGTSLPDRFVWDGRYETDLVSDGAVPEGTYRARLTLQYRHGNRPIARSEPVLLDITPPAITVRGQYDIFSPDGDGQRDTLEIRQSGDPADGWTGRIVDAGGSTVRRFTWSTRVESFTWDGTDEAGNVVPDGVYRYIVEGSDRAGNRATAEIPSIEVDTVPARLFVTVNRRLVAPGVTENTTEDAARDVTITLISSRTGGLNSRAVEVLDRTDRVVRTFRPEISNGSIPGRETITWDGRHENGRIVDGPYTVRYRATYRNGARPEVRSPAVTVDTTPPRVSVELEGLPFSPDNDGINDELDILLSAEDAGGIASWSFEIFDRNQRLFQEFRGTGVPRERIVWDGRSRTGDLVRSAEDYAYRFTATDPAGNRSTATGTIPIDILVVRDGDRLLIQIANITFEPNSPRLQVDPRTEAGAKNVEVLDRLVEIFARYDTYRIQVEGHAVNITGTEAEERQTLQPLSQARAGSVRDALVARGMDPGRITTVGRGGTEPIVPHTDLENRWQNRRVDFVLIR